MPRGIWKRCQSRTACASTQLLLVVQSTEETRPWRKWDGVHEARPAAWSRAGLPSCPGVPEGSEGSVMGVNQATNMCVRLSVADTQDIPAFTYRWVKGTTHLDQPMMGKRLLVSLGCLTGTAYTRRWPPGSAARASTNPNFYVL